MPLKCSLGIKVIEFSKLFTFGSVGRSTATDVLVTEMMSQLPKDQRKIIAFSDSRQDTALQSAHLNHQMSGYPSQSNRCLQTLE